MNRLAPKSGKLPESWRQRMNAFLGTADWYVSYTLVTPAQAAWCQILIVTAGHVAAVIALLDRALARERRDVARRALYPLVAVVVASAVAGMLLVLTA